MLVVSNTSPLSNLAIIGRVDLLREQLGSVTIPPGVRMELSRLPNSAARSALEQALEARWLSVVPLVAAVPADLALALDVGEAETLALALETKANLVLLDESPAALCRWIKLLPHGSRVRHRPTSASRRGGSPNRGAL
jgi:predicted nucleic acid-binding protein